VIDAYAVKDVYAAEEVLLAALPEGELMARAVAGLAEVARVRLEQEGGTRVVALVGPGNNGADAMYAAARLAGRGFASAAIYLADRVHQGALSSAIAAGVVLKPITPDSPADAVDRFLDEADLVIDGIVGIGGRPGLPEFAQPWVAAIPDDAYVLAVDLPSGQDPMGDAADACGVWADETVTFSAAKPVHLSPATEPACGMLTVIDIGLDLAADIGPEQAAVRRVERADAARLWPVPGPRDDKYSRGVVGVIAGGENYTGAAVLAVTAAANAGAGMVRYVGTPTPDALVRAAVPEAVHGVGQVQAWVVGPGLDVKARHAGAKAQLDAAREALGGDAPVVVDAGGLDLISGHRAAPTLLTPHAGECARLLSRLRGTQVTRSDVAHHPLPFARELADRTGATVLLKGAWTIVTRADGPAYSQNDAPSWLATAGAGDVLAGLLGTLLAAGLDPLDAGALGALVHGLAADRANPGGPVRARAVADALPAVIADLLRS